MPGPLSQTTISGKVINKKVHNPYKKTPNKETTSAVNSTTAVTTCIANNAEEEEAMILSTIKYNHMKGNTTNAGYKSAIRWYDIYKATDANLSSVFLFG